MMEDQNENQCQSCGTVYPQPVAYHSGTRECGFCWDWRKISGNAARYWNDQITGLFVDGKGSAGPDFNDLMQWKRWGVQREVIEALDVLEALRERYEILLNTDRETRNAILFPGGDAEG